MQTRAGRHAIAGSAEHQHLLLWIVTLRQLENGGIELMGIDPVTAMAAVSNDAVAPVAAEVKARLYHVLQQL